MAMSTKTKRNPNPGNTGVLLDKIRTAADENEHVSIGIILEKIGRRSYGPVLLFAGLIILAPLVGNCNFSSGH